MRELLNDIIRHIGKTSDQLETTQLVIDALAENYEANRDLIQELLYFKYDLQGM